jgi:hypothetical protein
MHQQWVVMSQVHHKHQSKCIKINLFWILQRLTLNLLSNPTLFLLCEVQVRVMVKEEEEWNGKRGKRMREANYLKCYWNVAQNDVEMRLKMVLECSWKWCWNIVENVDEMLLKMVLKIMSVYNWFSCKIRNLIVFQIYINYLFQKFV